MFSVQFPSLNINIPVCFIHFVSILKMFLHIHQSDTNERHQQSPGWSMVSEPIFTTECEVVLWSCPIVTLCMLESGKLNTLCDGGELPLLKPLEKFIYSSEQFLFPTTRLVLGTAPEMLNGHSSVESRQPHCLRPSSFWAVMSLQLHISLNCKSVLALIICNIYHWLKDTG